MQTNKNSNRRRFAADLTKALDVIKDSQIAPVQDPVNSPSHYTDGGIEVIDFIEAKKLGYHLGNAVKYICRAGKKDPAKELEDIKKAFWYLNRYKTNLEKAHANAVN